jgi:hypothetical protein
MDTDPEHSSDMWLWIDQISIEQSNIDERSRQVQMMSVIYLAADSVIAWLGIGNHPTGSEYNHRTEYTIAQRYTKTRRPEDLGLVLRNEYFSRLWIVQEFLIAECTRVLIRDVWILGKSDDFVEIMYQCRLSGSVCMDKRALELFMSRRHPIVAPLPVRNGRLEDALSKFSKGFCVDPRDRVYGLLGLVRLAEQIDVDYGKSPQQVLMDAILVILLTNPWLHFPLISQGGVAVGSKDWVPKLASYMDCTLAQRVSLEVMLEALWHEERLLCFNNFGCPITAMGFEPADANQRSIDQWWFEFQGERYHVECMHPAKIAWFNTKTASLLAENWQKYVPKRDQRSQALEREHQAWQRVTGDKIDDRYSPTVPQEEEELCMGEPLYTNKMAPHYPVH